MSQTDYEILYLSNRRTNDHSLRLIKEKRAFILRADRSYRHTVRLIRLLRELFEDKRTVGFWTRWLDFSLCGLVIGCQYQAVDKNNYSWHYEFTPEGVDMIFDPPA